MNGNRRNPSDSATPENDHDPRYRIAELKAGNQYAFRCPLEEVKHQLLALATDVVRLFEVVERDGFDPFVLGSCPDLEWLGDMSWNMGALMIHEYTCAFSRLEDKEGKEDDDSETVDKTGSGGSLSAPSVISTKNRRNRSASTGSSKRITIDFAAESRDIRLSGAEFLEAAASIYALVPYADKLLATKNQGLCLLLAATARIDAATMEAFVQQRAIHDSDQSSGLNPLSATFPGAIHSAVNMTRKPNSTGGVGAVIAGGKGVVLKGKPLGTEWMVGNLRIASKDAARADVLLASQAGFDNANDSSRTSLRQIALVTEYTALCKIPPDFVSSVDDAATSGRTGGSRAVNTAGTTDSNLHVGEVLAFSKAREQDFMRLSGMQTTS
jgi:hypothetical protein